MINYEKILKELKEKINIISQGENCFVKTIQILTPFNIANLNEIQRHTLSSTTFLDKYNSAVNKFIDLKDDKINRSLFYQQFDEPYRYAIYNANSKSINNDEVFVYNPPDKLPQLSDENYSFLSDEKNLTQFWAEWIKALKENNCGDSTFWTYICLPLEVKEAIFSAFIIFNGKLHKSKQQTELLKINKLVQKYLYKITSDLLLIHIIQQTTKSAISSVMARNMSHNIGSHVLAKLSTEESLKTLAVKNQEISKLNEYLKLRMDFLADIATTIPTFEVQKNITKDVLRFFNVGSKENYFKLIIEHITGNNKKVTINLPKEIYASFPNDLLGVQAFYVIIENIIRNTAKHSSSANDFEINFDIDENTYADFLSVTIYDNCNALKVKKNLVLEQNSRIKEPLLKDGVLRQNAWGVLEMKIAAAYLRKVSSAEIDFPKYNPSDNTRISDNKNVVTPPLIEADKFNDNLAYRVYLMKPKELLIVDCSNDKEITKDANPEQTNKIRKWGILYEKVINLNFEKIYNYNFVLLIEPTSEIVEKFNSKWKNFPFRKFICAKNQFDGFLKFNSNILDTLSEIDEKNKADELLLKFWDLWIANITSKQNLSKLQIEKWGEDNSTMSDKKLEDFELTTNPNNGVKEKAVFFHHICNQFHPKFSDAFYFEQYVTSSLITPLIDKIADGNKMLQKQFTESIICRIGIVDERIQGISKQNFNNIKRFINESGEDSGSLKQIEILEKAKIKILPYEEVDLNASEYNNVIKESIYTWITEKANSSDFLVIHLGILERLCETSVLKDEEKKRKIEKYLNNVQDLNSNLKIIVISGRGKPETLPDDTLFLHYSLISQYVLENRSKFHLTQLLYSARKQN